MKAVFLYYNEVSPLSDEVDWTLGGISTRLSTPDENDYPFIKYVTAEDVAEVGKWYRVELLEYLMSADHLWRLSPAVQYFFRNCRGKLIESMLIGYTKIALQERVALR